MKTKHIGFYKYISLKINNDPEIVKLKEKKEQLASEYWEIKSQHERRREELRSQFLQDKNKRAELKKQFKLEWALEILKRSTEK